MEKKKYQISEATSELLSCIDELMSLRQRVFDAVLAADTDAKPTDAEFAERSTEIRMEKTDEAVSELRDELLALLTGGIYNNLLEGREMV